MNLLDRALAKKSVTDVIQRSKKVEIIDDDGEENASFESLPTPPSTPIHQGQPSKKAYFMLG